MGKYLIVTYNENSKEFKNYVEFNYIEYIVGKYDEFNVLFNGEIIVNIIKLEEV